MSETKYPMIESLGLNVVMARVAYKTGSYDDVCCVSANDLEALLAKGVAANSWGLREHWQTGTTANRTHTGLIINIKEMEQPRPVTKEELLKAYIHLVDGCHGSFYKDLATRALKDGVSND